VNADAVAYLAALATYRRRIATLQRQLDAEPDSWRRLDLVRAIAALRLARDSEIAEARRPTPQR
jgi:hypothetical protein